jgi:SagB-type dehydrogenase family enzyme
LDLSWIVSLPAGLSVERGVGSLAVSGGGIRWVLRKLPAVTVDALARLAHPGVSLGKIADDLHQADTPAALAQFLYWLQEMVARRCLLISATAGQQRLATADPVATSFRLSQSRPPASPLVLSRFAYLHRLGKEMVVETPRSDARITLHDGRAVRLVHGLAEPIDAAALEGVANLPPEATTSLLGLFFHSGLLAVEGEEDTGGLQTWEFHDLLFHARSRTGRHDAPVGATFSFHGQIPMPPPVKPPLGGEVIELPRPDLARLEHDDPPLARVMESRCSVRDYGPEPITVAQLGEFLYRVARVKAREEVQMMAPGGPIRLDLTRRPYPAGGSLYELEVYPVVRSCGGLDSGLYHYDPQGHKLECIAGMTGAVAGLLEDAGLSAGIDAADVQVLLILAARFARVRWKYSSLAYALTLKNVGVLYQSMYLAATAMNLAPCALGTGDSDLFALAAGNDYYTETSVGEFLLGSKAANI